MSDETLSDVLLSSSRAARRVTLTKAQRATLAGVELITLLTELSDDGVVTRDEMVRLREWLEIDRGVDFAACPFLYEVIDAISGDGEISEDELDTLASAIGRVLPPEIRALRGHAVPAPGHTVVSRSDCRNSRSRRSASPL